MLSGAPVTLPGFAQVPLPATAVMFCAVAYAGLDKLISWGAGSVVVTARKLFIITLALLPICGLNATTAVDRSAVVGVHVTPTDAVTAAVPALLVEAA